MFSTAKMLTIGIAQVENSFDYEENFESVKRGMIQLAKQGADLVAFPECVSTGYNTGLKAIDADLLAHFMERVCRLAQSLGVAVLFPTPWSDGAGRYFNSVWLIDRNGEPQRRFDKAVLQKGEEILFRSGIPGNRVFAMNGVTVGVIICIESTAAAEDLLAADQPVDCIFWPGFYASELKDGVPVEDEQDGSSAKVRANARQWKAPLLQVNCASSPEAHYWPGRHFGGSMFIDCHGETFHRAEFARENLFLAEVRPGGDVRVKGPSAQGLLP